MRPLCLSVALLTVGLAGCKTCCHEEAGCPEQIVVKAPPQKVIVEQPVAPPAAPVAPPAAPAAAPAMMPMAYPQAPVAMPAASAVRERTGIGFTFDTFNIPIPCIRLIAVPKPTEVTYQIPPQPVAPVAYAPPVMPMAMPVAQPMYAAPPVMYQPVAPPPAAPVPPPAAPAPCPPITEQQCDEIIEKCNILKRLHQLRQHACDAAACPPK